MLLQAVISAINSDIQKANNIEYNIWDAENEQYITGVHYSKKNDRIELDWEEPKQEGGGLD